MVAICDHCGHRNEVPDEAENSEVLCQKCAQAFFALAPEEIAADRRATKLLLAAVLVVLAVIFALLLSRSNSGVVKTARRALVGSEIAGKIEGNGDNPEGSGESGDGNAAERTDAAEEGNSDQQSARSRGGRRGSAAPMNGLADPMATNDERSVDAPIGRLPQNLGTRKAGDDVRAGAAGTDDPADTIGNSRSGQITNAPSAGGNPGNSQRRNSVETPEGNESITGNSAGSDAGASTSTNSRNNALLLDDFSERLKQAGARSGDVQVSLEWKNVNDLDLHVIDPSGERIFYNHRNSQSGGRLDVDMNASQFTTRPVENVYWPERGAPRGSYRVEVVHYSNHGARDPTEFNVRVVNKGQSSYYRGYITYLNTQTRQRVVVCSFVVQ